MISLIIVIALFSNALAFTPTKLTFEELQQNSDASKETLLSGFEEVGLVSIKDIPDFAKLREEILTLSADCLQGESAESLKLDLNDKTKRYTMGFSTENGGKTDFSGPRMSGSSCVSFYQKQANFREIVQDITSQVVTMLDSALGLGEGTRLLMDTGSMEVASTIKEVVDSGLHLEHFHLYEKETSLQDLYSIDFARKLHTDHGLFIVLSPALTLDAQDSNDHGFFIQLQNGEIVQPDFGPERAEIVVMLGDGFKQWIEPKVGRSLRATPHAVVMPYSTNPVSRRSWYGRMILPKSTMYLEPQKITFGEMKDMMMTPDAKDNEYLKHSACSNGLVLAERFLQSCEEGTISCWNTCLPASCADNEEAKCGAIVDGSFIGCGTGDHGSQCSVQCLEEASTISGGVFPGGNEFCNGLQLSMYMDGFTGVASRNQACLIFLFDGFVLNSAEKYFLASVISFLVGVFTEYVVYLRRSIRKPSKENMKEHKTARVFLYALQVTFGYIAMLIAMTYSILLFFMVVSGLTFGHRVFNFNTAPPAENGDACCPSA